MIMAIVSSKSGQYIKVLRGSSVFTPSSVQVSFYSFKSKSDRDEFFKREKDVLNFVSNVNSYLIESYSKLNSDIESWAVSKGLSKISSVDKLPKDLRDRLTKCEDLSELAFRVKTQWNSSEKIDLIKDMSTALELGFDMNWLTPLRAWEISSLCTGEFTNQTFSYACLYKELKKVFGSDFVDC